MNHSKVSRKYFTSLIIPIPNFQTLNDLFHFSRRRTLKHAKSSRWTVSPWVLPDWESRQRSKPNPTTCKWTTVTWWGGKGAKKERVKTLSNSTVTLKPRLLSIFDSSTSNSSPGQRLLTPGALPFKLSWVYSCEAEEQGIKLNYNKQGHAVVR